MKQLNLKEITEFIIILLLNIYIFWGYIIPNAQILLYGTLVALTIYILFSKSYLKPFKSYWIPLFIFIIILVLNVLFSELQATSLSITIIRIICFVISILLVFSREKLFERFISFIFLFSSIHLIFIIIQYFNYTIFTNYVLRYFPSEIVDKSNIFYYKGAYAGVTEQTGVVAFYIVLNLLVLISYIEKEKYTIKARLVFLVFSVISFWGLYLTDKRGHLVAILIIISITIFRRLGIEIVKRILLLFTVTLISIIIIIFTSNILTNKESLLQDLNVYSSGRIDLYLIAIELFKEKPIFGWGLGYFNQYVGMGTHNMYLQILSELGIIGFFSFVFIAVSNLLNAFKLLSEGNQKEIKLFFILFQIFFLVYGFSGNPFNDIPILLTYCLSIIFFNLKGVNK